MNVQDLETVKEKLNVVAVVWLDASTDDKMETTNSI